MQENSIGWKSKSRWSRLDSNLMELPMRNLERQSVCTQRRLACPTKRLPRCPPCDNGHSHASVGRLAGHSGGLRHARSGKRIGAPANVPGCLRNIFLAMISACMLLACGDESDLPSLPPLPEDGSAGTYLLSFEHDDMTRWAIVHIPQSYSPGVAAPMLLNFHGYGHGAEGHMEWADMRPLAEEHGFVLVYPHGAGDEPHWNCAPLSKDNKSTNRDLEFVEQLAK